MTGFKYKKFIGQPDDRTKLPTPQGGLKKATKNPLEGATDNPPELKIEKPTQKPTIGCEIWEVKDIEIRKNEEYPDGRIEFTNKKRHSFEIYVKDLYRDNKWHEIIPTIKPLYLALHGHGGYLGDTVLQVDVWYEGKWNRIWNIGNNFDSFAETKKAQEKARKDYNNFIISEGKKIAKMIDEGKNYATIWKETSDEHSGFTLGASFHVGFSNAKNEENMKKVRRDYDIKHGGTGDE